MAVAIATEFELPVVATNEVVFLTADDFDAHEIRVAIHDGYTLMDKPTAPLQPPAVPAQSGGDGGAVCRHPGSPGNTVEIAKRCNDGAPGQVFPAQLPPAT
jgi:DNA polymerase-3 subunit alpha